MPATLVLAGVDVLRTREDTCLELPYGRRFSSRELANGHPGDQRAVYHSVEHSLRVQRMVHDLARRLGAGQYTKFLAEVGLLHDWDPSRAPGMPARVRATLDAIDADLAGREPLIPGNGGSILRARLGWTPRHGEMAKALIQRTEFPFDDTRADGYSPQQAYRRFLGGLCPADQEFVLRWGPILSEYADKASYYCNAPFRSAVGAVRGLANEIGAATGNQLDASAMGPMTAGFLKNIGGPEAFQVDYKIARELGLAIAIPVRREALTRRQRMMLRSQRSGFATFSGDTDRARRAANVAMSRLRGRFGGGRR